MKKTFYKIKHNDINILGQKQKLKGFNFMKISKNNSFNNKKNFASEYHINNNNTKLNNIIKQTSNNLNKISNLDNDQTEYGYIFYGKNKIFKTRKQNISQYNISSKIKSNLLNELKYNSKRPINNNISENKKYKNIKFKRTLSSDIILNANKNIKDFSDKKILEKNSYDLFPDIFGLNKKNDKNELNLKFWSNNNKEIYLDQLNQLHKNFLNSIKNHSGLFSEKDLSNNISSDNTNNMKININKKNNNLEIKNIHNQKWFNIKKINEYIKKEKPIIRNNINTVKIKDNNKYKNININNSLNKLDSNINKNENNKKISNIKEIDNYDIVNDINKKIKKSESTKINIKRYLNDKNNILDKKESSNSSLSSINFSNEEINDKKDKSNLKQNNEETNNNNNLNYKNGISKLFSFISRDNSDFSYNSKNNMKINEKASSLKEKINETKEKEDNTSNVKFNFKTSSYFFSQKFKKNDINKNKNEKDTNIKDIINNVIENNKRAAQARVSTSFYNIGNNFLNNKMRDSQKNFYSSSKNKNSYFRGGGDTNFSREQARDETEFNKTKKKSNYIQLTLLSPTEWEKHEEVWINISNKKYNENLEQFFLPPNDSDILISSYLKMYPNKLNICNYSKINTISKNEKEFLSFCIDDDILNPKNEIKKWKNVYKKMIFRWHPDKLFPLINELKIKNDFIKKEIERRSSLIINNINVLFQNIMEILKKIVLCKEKIDK